VFYLNVAYVLQWFQVFSDVFASVLNACFKCFICLQTYVTSVVSGCFKSKSGVPSPSSPYYLLLLLLPTPARYPNQRHRRALPLPPLLDVIDVRKGTGPRVRRANGV
jgi:hypothetical protein